MQKEPLFQMDFSKPVSVQGRVQSIRDLGHLKFFTLQNQQDEWNVVYEGSCRIKRGDHLNVQGNMKQIQGRWELQASQVSFLGHRNPRGEMANYFSTPRLRALFARSQALEAIHRYFMDHRFLQVHSPSIVSDWVNGQTGSFSMDFYGKPMNLTISNMMYHEIMMINGFTRIYEIAKIFRQEHPSSIHRLAEFTIVDIGLAYCSRREMMAVVEGMICAIYEALAQLQLPGFVPQATFETITFDDLVKQAGCPQFTGAQFPKRVRQYLQEHYDSFVWVTGFPEDKRPFFVRSSGGVCADYQLWYQGAIYLAAGGERETDLTRIQEKIAAEGKNVTSYQEILRFFETSVPPMCGIGMGLERFLATVIPQTHVADYIAFPRYQNHCTP